MLLDSEEYGWALVTWSIADVRSSPGHDCELVTEAVYGEAVELLRREGDWWHVRKRDGYLGWISPLWPDHESLNQRSGLS